MLTLSKNLKSKLIFDQYSRYLPTAKVIAAVVNQNKSEILDIGSGDECILGQLLPDRKFLFIDPLLKNKVPLSENHQCIAGDIFSSALDGKQFTASCSVDVLEHIPPEFRERFLLKVAELTSDLVVFSFPCKELDSGLLDEHMNRVYKSIFGKNYPWLDEHFRYGLPSSKEVETFFEVRGWNTYCYGHGHIPWLQEFLTFSLGALEIPALRNAVFEFSRTFNELAAESDLYPPFYRRVLIASKSEIGAQVEDLFSVDTHDGQLQSLTDSLKECFYSGVLRECRSQSEEANKRLAHSDQMISQLLSAHDNQVFHQEHERKILQDLIRIQEQVSPLTEVEKLLHEELIVSQNKLLEISAQSQTLAASLLTGEPDCGTHNPAEENSANLKSGDLLVQQQATEIQFLKEKNERYTNKISELIDLHSDLKMNLETEKYTVVKPLLRKLHRRAVSIFHKLPMRLQTVIRKVKRKLFPEIKKFLSLISKADPRTSVLKLRLLKQALSCGREGYDVLVFPVIDWHFRFQRPQHIASGLAGKGHRVFYFSTTFARGEPDVLITEQLDERVFICQFQFPAFQHSSIYEQGMSKKQRAFMNKALDQFVKNAGIKNSVTIVDHPFWAPVALAVADSLVVYDCMDDHSGFQNTAEQILQAESYLIKHADRVVTTSASLSEKIGQERSNTLIRNAADAEWFAQPPDRISYQSNRPVIGYFGAISEWFDIDLVITAARACPDYDFVLIGNTFQCNTKTAETVSNIHFIGEVPYHNLKEYLYAFDVCLIPFRLTELIQHTNPVKLYEYLASGKPVVATAMPELLLVEEVVSIAHDADSFVTKIREAYETKDEIQEIDARKRFAFENQWSNRVEQLEQVIESTVPAVSVIVLTYNNMELTHKCLESLMLFTHYPNWELIIVDNASTDGTQTYLQDFSEKYYNVKVIFNEENVGFAAGNNVGIEQSRGDYVVLLNNDTYVTTGWLWGMVRYFLQDDCLGLLGPVTNNIGNEAKIDITYEGMKEMSINSRKYTSEHTRELFTMNTVAFFCAMISRKVIDDVGLLDEVFGCGFFEDDDYCIRARNAGYKIAITEDVFIHHHLSASFNKLKAEQRQQLFEKNKRIFEEKWGEWIPHTYR